MTSVIFLLQFNNFARTTGFYWSYTLLLQPPVLMCSQFTPSHPHRRRIHRDSLHAHFEQCLTRWYPGVGMGTRWTRLQCQVQLPPQNIQVFLPSWRHGHWCKFVIAVMHTGPHSQAFPPLGFWLLAICSFCILQVINNLTVRRPGEWGRGYVCIHAACSVMPPKNTLIPGIFLAVLYLLILSKSSFVLSLFLSCGEEREDKGHNL